MSWQVNEFEASEASQGQNTAGPAPPDRRCCPSRGNPATRS